MAQKVVRGVRKWDGGVMLGGDGGWSVMERARVSHLGKETKLVGETVLDPQHRGGSNTNIAKGLKYGRNCNVRGNSGFRILLFMYIDAPGGEPHSWRSRGQNHLGGSRKGKRGAAGRIWQVWEDGRRRRERRDSSWEDIGGRPSRTGRIGRTRGR